MKYQGNMLAWVIACGIVLVAYAPSAQAQWHGGGGHNHGGGGGYFNGGNVHHHHDAAGHRVDDSGHHIDHYGNHSGSAGVYDSVYQTPAYSRPYISHNPHGNNYVPRPAYSGEPIRIVNPMQFGSSLHYDLNEYHYDILPGQSQTIRSDRSWIVSFDRGEGNGEARYTLYPGAYEFRVTDGGWELFRLP